MLGEAIFVLTATRKYEAQENQDSTIKNIGEFVESIKKAATIRTVLCHTSWRVPDIEGKSLPLFVNRNKEIFETKIDVPFLRQVQITSDTLRAMSSTLLHKLAGSFLAAADMENNIAPPP